MNDLTIASSTSDSIYYARHFRLPGFDATVQDKLRQARVLIVGVGGLGCPAALYLAGAGIGTITLCDADLVSVSNLHRQVLFDSTCVGEKKVEAAAKRLRATNPNIRIEVIPVFADTSLLDTMVKDFDVVLDGTDNFSAKYAINDACERAGVPFVYGAIFQFQGQVSVFHAPTVAYPSGLSYRDLYPDAPPAGLAQSCGEAGVIGVLPGIIGTLQANEVIKLVTGLGEPLVGSLLTFDSLAASFKTLTFSKRKQPANILSLEDKHEITDIELEHRLKSSTPPLLVDVREANEREQSSSGGLHIPLAQLPKHLDALRSEKDIVVYCQSGMRSGKAALYLRSVFPESAVFSLKGGMCSR